MPPSVRQRSHEMEIPRLDAEYTARVCFACGQENPIGLKLKPIHDGEKVIAEFTAGEFHQGWKNAIHGGILYTLLDEVNAYAMLCRGIEFGVTARSEISFKQAAPINEPIQASAWVTKVTKRLVETRGVLTLKDNTVLVDGNFLFYVWRQSKKTVLWDRGRRRNHGTGEGAGFSTEGTRKHQAISWGGKAAEFYKEGEFQTGIGVFGANGKYRLSHRRA